MPTGLTGRVSANTTCLGRLKPVILSLHQEMISSSVACAPSLSTITARTTFPQVLSGTPMTQTESTSSWFAMISSTSWGKTFSAPVLMHSFLRSTTMISPSASR